MTASLRGMLSRPRLVGLGVTAILMAGLAAVYVSGAGQGNGGSDAPCLPSLASARQLLPLAGGEVAAFQPAREAISLAGLRFKDADGKELDLSAFSGKTVLINLWATWCVPCRTEMPALDRLQAARGGDDFAVLAVNIDTREDARPQLFLREIGANRLAYYADPTTGIFGELKKRGLAVGLPTTVLVDPKGCQLGAVSGPAEWDSNDAKALIEAAVKGAAAAPRS